MFYCSLNERPQTENDKFLEHQNHDLTKIGFKFFQIEENVLQKLKNDENDENKSNLQRYIYNFKEYSFPHLLTNINRQSIFI